MGSSLYLAAQPDFWYGMARLLDLGNTFDVYNECPAGEQADSIGVLLDWEMVGKDLWLGVSDYDLQINPGEKMRPTEIQLINS